MSTPRPPVSETFPHIRTPWKAILAELRDAIERGDMVPGEPVGSLAMLAKMCDVNVKTAHKAMRAALAERLVENVPGGPYRVAKQETP